MKRKRKKGSGAAKGSAFERAIAKALSKWLTNGAMIDCIWRTAASGGRATVAARKSEKVRQAGDLCPVSAEAHWFFRDIMVECKHLRDYNLLLALSGTGPLLKIWNKLLSQAATHQRYPVLIIKQNARPTLWITTRQVMAITKDVHARAIIFVSKSQPDKNMHIAFLDDVLSSPVPSVWKREVSGL